jgi:hypothetical protein
MELADFDNVGLGVLATKMGESFFSHLGYDCLEKIHIISDQQRMRTAQ